MRINEIITFPSFYEKIQDKQLPFKLVYQLSKLNKSINSEIEFYREQLRKIIDKYCEKDSQGNPITVDNGGVKVKAGEEAACQAAIRELESVEITIDYTPFSLEDFEGLNLSPNEFQGILPFLKD